MVWLEGLLIIQHILNLEIHNKQLFIMSDSIIKNKSFSFAIRVINLYKFLIENKREYVLSKQLLRSGTAVCSYKL